MIEGDRSVGIFVGDQQDMPMGEADNSPRWIEVALPDKNVVLVLFSPEEQRDRIGSFSNALFHADDINATYEELVGRGVEFPEAPTPQHWGWWAFKDPDGNTYGSGQRGA